MQRQKDSVNLMTFIKPHQSGFLLSIILAVISVTSGIVPYFAVARMTETFRKRLRLDKNAARKLSMDVLQKVNLLDTDRVYRSYPSQLSGGMLQRATMAILIGLSPRYIFADEPTSALDEENKEYLIQVLMRMKQQAAILFVSHDDAAIRTLCDDLLVMQSGIIVEYGTTADLFAAPHKEWTKEFVRLAMVEEGGGWTWQKSKSEM